MAGERAPACAVLRRLLLVLFGIGVAVAFAEVALRVTDRIPDVNNPLYSFHDSDPGLGWRGKANARLRFRRPDFDVVIAHDADGWRLPDPARPERPLRRVLVLGDSFTWGWGVNQGEVFTDHLQRRLGPEVAVYNRGVNGFGTSQEYLLMKRELEAGQFDAVVVMFFQNDMTDDIAGKNGRRPIFDLDGDRLVPRNQPARRLLNPFERFLKDHSRAYQLIDFQVGRVMRALFQDDEDGWQNTDDGTHVDYHEVAGAVVTQRILSAMHRLASEHGARLIVVYLPHRSEIEGDRGRNANIRAAHALVQDFAASERVALVDLTAPFREHIARGDALIYPHDEHWSPAGHAVAAEALLASGALAGNGVPPPQ